MLLLVLGYGASVAGASMRRELFDVRRFVVLLAVAAAFLAGCSSGGDKKPPKPHGPVKAVVLDANGNRRASIQADGALEQAVADGDGGWFVSGQFRNIGGYDRGYLAHIESDGDVDPDWDPILDRNETTVTVSAHLAVGGDRVYLAGDFGSVDGKPRSGGAALDADSGELEADWKPNLGTVADAIAVSPGHVIVATGTHVDAYDAASGARDPAFRLRVTPGGGDEAVAPALAVSGTRLYLGGRFRRVNGTARPSLARVDAATGRLDRGWSPPAPRGPYGCRRCIGRVTGLALTTTSVYSAGDFRRAGGLTAPSGLAGFATGSGRPDAGFRAPSPGKTYDGYAGTYDVAAALGSRVLVGGEFVGGVSHGFVTLDARSGRLLASQWHPKRRSALVQHIVPSGSQALVAGDKIGP
jgi:hypothetical protein